jgi:hypothetical protein
VQRFPDVVEAISRGIFWQHFLEFDVDIQQVANSILVLDAIEPAKNHAALAFFGHGNSGIDPLGQKLNFLLGRSRLPLGRHLAGLDAFHRREPAITIGRNTEISRQIVETQVALGLRGTVTRYAVMSNERPTEVFSLASFGNKQCHD